MGVQNKQKKKISELENEPNAVPVGEDIGLVDEEGKEKIGRASPHSF
jgi:hypothetical protein